MTLAARCPSCGTVFRVVQDQLRVSEGWVRCGRCAEVFNAIDGLVELDSDAAAKPPPRQAGRERVLEELARVTYAGELAPDPAPPVAPVSAAEPPRTAVPAAPEFDDSEFRAEPELRPAPAAGASNAPEFVRRADRAARWRRPGVRLALGAGAVVFAMLLAGQVVIEYRDLVGARWPGMRGTIESACATLGCRIEAPRLIEALAVESSGLVRIEGTPSYRLSVVLRNRSTLPLALPAVDLTLTDTQGAVIARRVVRLGEFGVAQRSLPGGGELPLQAVVSAVERPISGYTIEIFYP